MQPWMQIYDPLGNLWLSSLVAALPIIFFFVALAILRMKGHVAGTITVTIALAVAIFFYKMPVEMALAQRPVKVAAQHREAPVGGGGSRLRVARGKVGLQVVFGRVVQRQGGLLIGQPLRVQRQVAPVGGQRVARQAVLQPQGVHKGVDGVQTGSKHPKTIACIACIQLHRHKKAARRRLGMEAVAFIPASASA